MTTVAEPRSGERRRADSLVKLRTETDVWVASASVSDDGSGYAHLIPLSLAWIDDRVVIAVEPESRTARNIVTSGAARLAVGPTRDVVIIDAVLEGVADRDDPSGIAQRYADHADWDPRNAEGQYVYVVLRPDRVQAWREASELKGRTLMRAGTWLV